MNLRLPIVIGIYAFIVVFLPKNPDIARLLGRVSQIDPSIAIIVSAVGLVVSACLLWMIWRKPNGWMLTRPSYGLIIANMGLVGVAFAGAFDVMEWISGSATTLVSMILVPTAFVIAESVYLLIHWRLNRKFDE